MGRLTVLVALSLCMHAVHAISDANSSALDSAACPNEAACSQGPAVARHVHATGGSPLALCFVGKMPQRPSEVQQTFVTSAQKTVSQAPVMVDSTDEAIAHLLSLPGNAVVVLVLDYESASSKVSFLADEAEILDKFGRMKAQMLLGVCLDDRDGCLEVRPRTFVQPSLLLGKAAHLAAYLQKIAETMQANSQWTYSQVAATIISRSLESSSDMVLDTSSQVFQTLGGFEENLGEMKQFEMVFDDHAGPRLKNLITSALPCLVHSGRNRKLLEQMSSYAPRRWLADESKMAEQLLVLSRAQAETKTVLVSLLVPAISPFLPVALRGLQTLAFPKNRMHLHVHLLGRSRALVQKEQIEAWLSAEQLHDAYAAAPVVQFATSVVDALAADAQAARQLHADFVWALDTLTVLKNPDTLHLLLQQDLPVVAPMVTRSGKFFSNFWGSLIDTINASEGSQCTDAQDDCAPWAKMGECKSNAEWMLKNCARSCGACAAQSSLAPWQYTYRRSFDYFSIVERNRLGTFKVQLVFSGQLMSTEAISKVEAKRTEFLAADSTGQAALKLLQLADFENMQLAAAWLHEAGHFVHITNLQTFGYLIDPLGYNASKAHPELFLIENNQEAFKDFYIHARYDRFREPAIYADHPCGTEVYRLPIFNQRFCKDLIAEAEHYGRWSGGGTYDDRLKGGYEPVPTVDIHFRQMQFATPWYYILTYFVKPVTDHHYVGYHLNGKSTLDFIVKYTPTGQSFLRPHFDASTVTLNVALNQHGVDFEGGGTHFLRQNCTCLDMEPGEGVLFPGRLTHYHEGLPTTKGTRYIAVSFIDQT